MPKESYADRVCANCLWWHPLGLRPGITVTDDLEIKHRDQVGECRGDRPQLVVSRQVESETQTGYKDGAIPVMGKLTRFKYVTRYPRPRGDKTCPEGVYRKPFEDEGLMEPFFEDPLEEDVVPEVD